MNPRAVYLLDADPDLAEALDPETLAAARPYAVARTGSLPEGPWDPPESHHPVPADLGLLVMDGLLSRDVAVAGRSASEVLGSGDLLRPWDPQSELEIIPVQVSWTVLAPVRYAVLDARFTLVAARWPALMSAIVGRALRRSRALVFHLGLAQVTGIDTRLLLVLWELAQRWGHVTPDGVSLRLNLTHEMLARLIGARRPSVTTALKALQDQGRVIQEDRGRWLLPGQPPTEGDLASDLGAT